MLSLARLTVVILLGLQTLSFIKIKKLVMTIVYDQKDTKAVI